MKNIKDKGPLAREMLRLYETFSSEIKFTELADPLETWELQELVGEGTYGVVHSARHKQTGEIVAVKILEAIHELIEEIEEEYVILRDLGNHPNMPKFHGIYLRQSEFRGEDQLWIAMELCGRGSVTHLTRELMKQKSAMDEKLIAHILGETLKVLVHLHTNHIIHRDIKGHNILITDEGKVKLIDFGVSTTLKSTNDRRRTSVGTPYWMAPEVIACERQLEYNYDLRCDIWSLGITAIELADGEPPLADLHPMRALFKIPRNPTPTLTKPAQWSDEFNDFVSQCLIKDFELRPQARDLLNHPFIQQVAAETSVYQRKLHDLTSSMDQTVHQPDVTVKKGRPKSHRKSKRGDTVKSTEDLATLEILDEGVIVSQLRSRYKDEEIYTYIGDILLAVNPFQPINIYNDEYSKMYMNAAKDANPPHIYAVADQSYQMMMHYKKHQCIVISGESGAGKTESANLMVQQLTQLGKAGNRTLEERILQVNPLMEAFGNAKTVINDNSSRFGKYLEMFFTISGTVIGAKITEYLLEKSRVISQARGEQNFHIFYYIHDGLSSEEKKTQFLLKENVPYRYIEEYTSGGIDIAAMAINRVKFKAIQHCFDIIGFKPKEVSSVCGIIASILNLGNVNFDEKETGHGGNACSITSRPLVEAVSSTLGIPNVELVEALTTTGMVARGELIVRGNSVPEALDARDAMAKALYGRLFSWIVNHINILLKPQTFVAKKEEENHIIGILDIFGFEHIPNNSFEQLCINIANEQIQYYFNQHIFAWEMQEYQNEGLEVLDITFVDNRPLLDMFLMKPLGLLALLDEESHFPKATDKSLVEKFHRNINNKYYCRPKGNSLVFSIDHYAGRVEYDANGFLEKNRDRLPGDVLNMLRASSNEVVRALFQTPLTKTGNLASGSIASSLRSTPSSSAISSPASTSSYVSVMSYNKHQQTSGMGGSRIYSALGSASASMTRIQQTVATYFRFSLMDLLAKMVAGTPHFVRCIRPNANKHPDDFNSEKVTIQLRYTGVLETTRIRREGYSHRIPFADFLRRYHMLSFRWDERVPHTRDSCYTLLDRLGMDHFALGKTKVFLKYYHIEQLARQYEAYHRKVITLQSVIRSWHARTLYYRNKWQREKAATLIQSRFRGFVIQRKFQKEFKLRKGAAVAIQTAIKGFLVRRKTRPVIEKRRKATVLIQSKIRGHLARKSVREQKTLQEKREKSAISIQKVVRGFLVRKFTQPWMEKKMAAIVAIQRYVRDWLRRSREQEHLRILKSSVVIQRVVRGFLVRKKVRPVLIKRSAAVLLLQSWLRGCLARKRVQLIITNIQKEENCAIIIQKAMRRYVACKQFRTEFCRKQAAILIIQCWVRRLLAYRRVEAKIQQTLIEERSAVTIQQAVRLFLTRKQKLNEQRNNAALVIQAFVRDWLLHRQIESEEEDVLPIVEPKATQKQVRKFRWKKVLKLRTGLRVFLGRRSMHEKKNGNREHTLVTQEAMRGYIVCKQMFDIHRHMAMRWKAVVMIQTAWRDFLRRKSDREMKDGSKVEAEDTKSCVLDVTRNSDSSLMEIFEMNTRAVADKQTDESRMLNAAMIIQSYWRGFLARQALKQIRNTQTPDSLSSQRAMRGILLSKQLYDKREKLQKRWKAVLTIQACVRGFLARQSLQETTVTEQREKFDEVKQSAFRSYRARINARQLRKKRIQLNIQSAIMIQKYYRRWRCRTVYQQLLLYKSQRDTQVLFFTQQVEMYNKDLLQNMMKNMAPRKMEPKMEDQTKRKKSLAPGPPTNATPLPVTVPEPPPPPAQVTKEVDNIYAKVVKPKKAESPKPRKPEVSEERLHQIFKMNELKSVMPPIETKYYDELNNFVPDPDYPGSEEEVPVTVVRADVHPPPPSVPEHLIRKSETKSVMKTENESYYHDITEDILAPPSESDSTYHVPSDQIVDWDVPLLQAKHNALSLIKENKTNGVHKPTDDSEDKDDSDSERTKLARSIAEAILNKGDSSIPLTNGHHYIEEDPAPIHDELQSEYSKQDLAKRLEDECAGSVVSLWQQRQRKPNESGTNGTNTQPPPPPLHPPPSIPRSRMAAPVLTIPPPPSSPPPPTPPRKSPSPVVLKTTPPKVDVNGNENMMSPPSASKVKFALTPSIIPQSSTNGHVNVTSDNNDPTSDFRKRLRKTNIDLSQDNIFKATSAESEPKHFDFRSRLKKTGRIPETK
ncbi:myosin-IIIb-like isoform X3 [Mizuhopecten yessoensis]|uniref:myosin-IIIb-like isoform X3 n=1 Tax=Mizuhopecten yessoensis TaxID=6573 RepID=UPI000B45A35E|nr:myosin-IIIb-like isoform X3 [Mizuhopecten yessoensis]